MARSYMDIVAMLPPELQQRALERQSELEPQLGQWMPENTDAQIANAAGSWRGEREAESSRARLERALEKQQSASGDLMSGISGPKYVPSAWGPIAVRQSPLMNVIKAIRTHRAGQDVQLGENDLSGLYDAEAGRLKTQSEWFRDQNRQANERGAMSARDRIMQILTAGGGA